MKFSGRNITGRKKGVFKVSMHVGTENFYQVGHDLLNHRKFQVSKSGEVHLGTAVWAPPIGRQITGCRAVWAPDICAPFPNLFFEL